MYQSLNFFLVNPSYSVWIKKYTITAIITILQPLYRTTCISWPPQLTTEGLCCSEAVLHSAHMLMTTATSSFKLRRKCY